MVIKKSTDAELSNNREFDAIIIAGSKPSNNIMSTDSNLSNNRNKGFDAIILKRYLTWLNLKRNNRMHWNGKRKGGNIYLF